MKRKIGEKALEKRIRSGEVLAFDLEESPVCRNIYMVYQRKGAMSELAKAFVAMMRSNPAE